MNYFGLWLLHSVIGSKFSRHFFNQSEVKPKPIVARACTFSRALCRLRVITSSFDWFTGLSPNFLIGQSNYFGFGFTTLNWKLLYPWNKVITPFRKPPLVYYTFCTVFHLNRTALSQSESRNFFMYIINIKTIQVIYSWDCIMLRWTEYLLF